MNKKELIKTLFFPEREFAHQQVLLLCKSHDLSTDFIFNGNNKDNYHTKEHCLDVAFMAFNMVQVIVNKEDRYIHFLPLQSAVLLLLFLSIGMEGTAFHYILAQVHCCFYKGLHMV